MRCPRCQEENPPGRGFCIKCAYPLPEEPRQQQNMQQPVEPIRFDMQPNAYYAPNAVPKRTNGMGVAALVFGILGLFALYLTTIFSSVGPQLLQQYLEAGLIDAVEGMGDGTTLAAICAVFYGFFGMLFGTLGTVFGGVGVSRVQKQPQAYRGKGVAIAGLIISVVVLVGCAIGFFAGITVL